MEHAAINPNDINVGIHNNSNTVAVTKPFFAILFDVSVKNIHHSAKMIEKANAKFSHTQKLSSLAHQAVRNKRRRIVANDHQWQDDLYPLRRNKQAESH